MSRDIISVSDLEHSAIVAESAELLPIKLVGTADVEKCQDIMRKAGKILKAIEERRKAAKQPYLDLNRKIDARAKIITEPMSEIEAKCKELLGRWTYEKERADALAEAVALEVAEEIGRATPDLTVPDPAVSVFTPKVFTRTNKVARITEIALLPLRYLIPDMPRIDADLRAGIPVPGAELVESQTIVNRQSS